MLTNASRVLKQIWATITKNVISTSGSKSLNKIDWLKVLRNALFVGSTSSLVFLIENIADSFLTSMAQGLALATLNGLVDIAFRYFKNNDNKVSLDDNERKES